MTTTQTQLTDASLKLFIALAEDAPNWGGMPPINGNVSVSKQERGNVSDLIKKGLILTDWDPESRLHFVSFTDAGAKLAAEHGITSLI